MSANQSLPPGTPFSQAIDYAVLSHIGQRRDENQDSFSVAVSNSGALFVVADGMGGASGGAQASAVMARMMADVLTSASADARQNILKSAIVEANQEIFNRGRRNPSLEGMGTTVSGVFLTTEAVLICNVGDSRVYRLRDSTIAQLTTDHTLVGELLESGALTPEQALQSPVSHMLTRSVGPSPELDVDCYYLEEAPLRGDIYLICSDGLYNTMSSAEIGYVLGEYRLHDALEHLVGLANMRGGADNISAILVECHKGFLSQRDQDTGARSSQSAGTKKKIVEVELAEAAASDTFSRVKKEVDISAEILWGGHAGKNLAGKQVAQADDSHRAIKKTSSLTTIQRAIAICSLVFVGTLVWAYIVHQDRIALERHPASPSGTGHQIIDFNRENELLEDAAQSEGAPSRERRRALIARLEAGANDIPEVERMARRRARLIEASSHLQHQISSILLPPDSALLEVQKKLEVSRESLQARLHELDKEIERIGLSLNRWRLRLEEIDEIDTVNLTSELAQFSTELKDKKESFEQATWRYLKRLEDQRFDPANSEIQHDVDQLVRDRNQRLDELAKSAREFIEGAIGRDARERGLLLIEREETLQDEKSLLADLGYVTVRLSGDKEKQRELLGELEKRRVITDQELAQLGDIETPAQVTAISTMLASP